MNLLETQIAELDALLARPLPKLVHRRAMGVRLRLTGVSAAEAARLLKAGDVSIATWFRAYQQGGIPAISRKSERPSRRKPLTPAQIRKARPAIQGLLAHDPPLAARQRLEAVLAVLDGSSIEAAAGQSQVAPKTVSDWIGILRRNGAKALLKDWRPTTIVTPSAQGDALRAVATEETDRHAIRRLVAVAFVLDGMAILDAAVRVNSDHNTVAQWTKRFETGGLDALRKPRTGAPTLLTAKQMQELEEMVLSSPGQTWPEWRDTVKSRFGVDYTPAGIRRLVVETLNRRAILHA